MTTAPNPDALAMMLTLIRAGDHAADTMEDGRLDAHLQLLGIDKAALISFARRTCESGADRANMPTEAFVLGFAMALSLVLGGGDDSADEVAG